MRYVRLLPPTCRAKSEPNKKAPDYAGAFMAFMDSAQNDLRLRSPEQKTRVQFVVNAKLHFRDLLVHSDGKVRGYIRTARMIKPRNRNGLCLGPEIHVVVLKLGGPISSKSPFETTESAPAAEARRPEGGRNTTERV